jgi:hypothetical protein
VPIVLAQAVDALTADPDLPGRGRVHRTDEIQQCGLSGPTASQDDDQFPGADVDIDIREHKMLSVTVEVGLV